MRFKKEIMLPLHQKILPIMEKELYCIKPVTSGLKDFVNDINPNDEPHTECSSKGDDQFHALIEND
jgi:hypothetical protein